MSNSPSPFQSPDDQFELPATSSRYSPRWKQTTKSLESNTPSPFASPARPLDTYDADWLSMPLDGFDVSLTPGARARLERIAGDRPEAWRLVHFDPAPGCSGALAARTGGREIALTWRETL